MRKYPGMRRRLFKTSKVAPSLPRLHCIAVNRFQQPDLNKKLEIWHENVSGVFSLNKPVA